MILLKSLFYGLILIVILQGCDTDDADDYCHERYTLTLEEYADSIDRAREQGQYYLANQLIEGMCEYMKPFKCDFMEPFDCN